MSPAPERGSASDLKCIASMELARTASTLQPQQQSPIDHDTQVLHLRPALSIISGNPTAQTKLWQESLIPRLFKCLEHTRDAWVCRGDRNSARWRLCE